MKNRIISLILAMTLLFSLVSCNKAEDIPPKDKILTVEKETVVYSDEKITAVCEGFADIFARVAPHIGYPVINEEREENIAAMLKSDIIPIARAIPIYEDELLALVAVAEEYVALYEDQNKDEINPGFMLGLYTKFNTVLDSERLGRFIYYVQLRKLRLELFDAQEVFDKRGQGEEKVEHYSTLLADAETLGEAKFADAVEVMTFILTSSFGLGDIKGGAFGITSSDALAVIQKQARRLNSLGLTDRDWQTVAAICEENIPTGNDSLKSKILISLDNDDFFVGAATLMTDVIDFYVILAENASKESVDMMASGEDLAYEIALYTEMIKNEAALESLLDKISGELPSVCHRSSRPRKV